MNLQHDNEDRQIWSLENSKGLYHGFNFRVLSRIILYPSFPFRAVWKSMAPLKVSAFVWEAYGEGLNTLDPKQESA